MLVTDKIDILVSKDNRLTFINGQLQLSSGLPGIEQAQRIRLLDVAGEWFMDLDDGVMWLERPGVLASQAILGQKFNRSKLINIISDVLLKTPGTNDILLLTAAFDAPTRLASVVYQTMTIFGATSINTLERVI